MSISTRTLGRTGAEVSILGYGAMELRGAEYMGGPPIDDREAGRLLAGILDAGITLIDTAIDYGHSEELIGRHLGSRRDEFLLASKCGCPLSLPPGTPPTPDTHDWGADNLRAGVEQSLRRLRTDRLDLVQVHLSPSRTVMEREHTIETLQGLRDEGKLRFLGMSGTQPDLADHIAMGVFDVFQIPYSAVQRDHEPLVDRAARAGAGVVIRGGTARGTAAESKRWTVEPLSGTGVPARDQWQAAGLDELLGDLSPHEFMLRFTLSHPGVSSAIVGTSSLDHLRANVEIAQRGPLPDDVYAEARRRLSR